jgi:hypothetical protein
MWLLVISLVLRNFVAADRTRFALRRRVTQQKMLRRKRTEQD